jgi:hypothetical protein
MSTKYRVFFGMSREAFPQDPALKDILETPDISHTNSRFSIEFDISSPEVVFLEVSDGWSDVGAAASFGIRGVNTAEANDWKRTTQVARNLECLD